MIFFKNWLFRAGKPEIEQKGGEGEESTLRARTRWTPPFNYDILKFNEFPWKVAGGIRANLINCTHTFRNCIEGKDAFWLVNRNRQKGLFPVFLGHTIDHQVISVDFQGRNTIVCGTSRWGKTNFLRQLLIELMHWNHPQYLRIAALDAKKVGFVEAANLIDVRGGYDDSKEYIDELSQELQRRKKIFPLFGCSTLRDAITKRGLRPTTPPFLVAIIDEYADFLAQAEKDKKGEKLRKQLDNLASQGLGFGISLVLTTQTPSRQIMDNMIKNNIATKIFFNMEHRNAWQYLAPTAHNEAQMMEPGDFLMTAGYGIQRGHTILIGDEPFKVACRNIKANGKDFRRLA